MTEAEQIFHTVEELQAQLDLDNEVLIFFVEGKRDLAFWNELLPISERDNGVIYPIDLLDIKENQEGAKGRCLKLLQIFYEKGLHHRVKVFVDDDYDSILEKEHPDNVITTDYKDLESYFFEENILSRVITTGFAIEIDGCSEYIQCLKRLCWPIGIARILSIKEKLLLPFSKTFENSKRRKFIDGKNTDANIDFERLIRILIQNSNNSLSGYDLIAEKIRILNQELKDYDCRS